MSGGLIPGGDIPISLQPGEKIMRRDGSVWMRSESGWVEVGRVDLPNVADMLAQVNKETP